MKWKFILDKFFYLLKRFGFFLFLILISGALSYIFYSSKKFHKATEFTANLMNLSEVGFNIKQLNPDRKEHEMLVKLLEKNFDDIDYESSEFYDSFLLLGEYSVFSKALYLYENKRYKECLNLIQKHHLKQRIIHPSYYSLFIKAAEHVNPELAYELKIYKETMN